MKHYTKKEKSGLEGIVTFTSYEIDSPEAFSINAILETASNMPKEQYEMYCKRLSEICKIKNSVRYNKVVLSGRSVYSRRAIGDNTYTGEINYGALGTGSTAVADGDTVLDTEVKRKGIASRSRSGSSFTIDFYYSKADTNGTYEEFGMFIDGTSTVDTGQLFNRVLTGGWTKSASEAMTVSIQIDFNAV